MPTEKLYDIALQFKKTKLWNQLCDTEMFALKLSNGQIGYCCVMGEIGEYQALALYIGRDGLDSYRKLFQSQEAISDLAHYEKIMSQNCLQCSFENKDELHPSEIELLQCYAKLRGITFRGRHAYPQFKRYRPAHYPWFLTDELEQQLMYEALSAALEVSSRLKTTSKSSLGFVNDAPYDRVVPLVGTSNDSYEFSTIVLPVMQEKPAPSPVVSDELLVARLKNKKKTGVWACEVIMFPNPTSDETGDDDGMVKEPVNAPAFPFMLLTVDTLSEMIIPSNIFPDFDNNAENLVTDLAHVIYKNGVPAEIHVRDTRTEALLSAFARQLGIKVIWNDDLSILDEVEDDMLDHFNNDQADTEDQQDQLDQLLYLIMELDDQALRSMPSDIWKPLLELDNQGLLPPPVSARIRKLTE